MSRKEWAKRQERIVKGLCPRCGKRVEPWFLRRPDNCGIGGFTCMRNWPDIHKAEARIEVSD